MDPTHLNIIIMGVMRASTIYFDMNMSKKLKNQRHTYILCICALLELIENEHGQDLLGAGFREVERVALIRIPNYVTPKGLSCRSATYLFSLTVPTDLVLVGLDG